MAGVPNPWPIEVFQLSCDHFIKLEMFIGIDKYKT